MIENPKLSVCMITYNHERFIAQAIESVLEQKTAFDFELVIGEDCSTDGTRTIVMRYAQRYPAKIRAFIRDKNLGLGRNGPQTINECHGQYVAMLEGDDYWIDPDKLQMQVDFLDANPSYSLCCHRCKIYDEETGALVDDDDQKLFVDGEKGKDITTDIFFTSWVPSTLTVVFRKELFDINIATNNYLYDAPLYFDLLSKGNGYFLNYSGAIYRKHHGGMYSKKSMFARAELIYLTYKNLYKVRRSPLVKKIYISRCIHLIYCAMVSRKRPYLNIGLYKYIFNLFLLSPPCFCKSLIKVTAIGFLHHPHDPTIKKANA